MLNQRAISFRALMCVVIATTLVGRAETIFQFPNVSVGDLYYTEPSKFFCGPDVEVYGLFSEWQYLAPARGEVHLPDGVLIQLSLSLEPEKSRSSQYVVTAGGRFSARYNKRRGAAHRTSASATVAFHQRIDHQQRRHFVLAITGLA